MFTSEEDELISNLRKYAESHILSLDDVKATAMNLKAPIGDTRDHVINVGGLRVVFSIETQPKFLARHLSVSESLASKPMSKEERHQRLFQLAAKLGIVPSKDVRSTSWVEEKTPFGDAINILQEVPVGDQLLSKPATAEQV